MINMMITLTKIELIRQYDEYNKKEIIILDFMSWIITFEFNQFEWCYNHILIWLI